MTTDASAVTAQLYREYFASSAVNEAGMSSHWRAFAPRSSVSVDARGVPTDAIGIGFGDMSTRRRGTAVFTALAAVGHGLSHPAARRLPKAMAAARRATRLAGLVFNQDALRQACTLALLADRLPAGSMRRVILIGDGYGLLGALIAEWQPAAQIVFVDLGRSLLFQAMTCGRIFHEASHALAGRDGIDAVSGARFVYCPADRLDRWPFAPSDLAVNVASMQEMSPEVVADYFDRLRAAPAQWFYCCNRDRKEMPGGEVSAFLSYPWTKDDEHVVDGLCPWHQWYVAPVRGAGRFPISLRARYDGPHLHRLTRLAPRVSKKGP